MPSQPDLPPEDAPRSSKIVLRVVFGLIVLAFILGGARTAFALLQWFDSGSAC